MSFFTGLMPLYMVDKPPFSIDAPGYAPVEGETIPRRHPAAKDGLLTTPAPGVRTAFDILKRSTEQYGDEPAVGSRELIKTHREMKKVPKVVDGQVQEVEKEWTFFELTDYSYMTYKQYEAMVLQIGSGLRKLGLEAKDRVHIFAATRYVSKPLHARSAFADQGVPPAHNGSPPPTHPPPSLSLSSRPTTLSARVASSTRLSRPSPSSSSSTRTCSRRSRTR